MEPSDAHSSALCMHAGMRLYGGAQYWRAIQEFAMGAAEVPDAELTVEEIVNAMGFDGYHDGVNYLRAVCIIVLQRAKGFFEVSCPPCSSLCYSAWDDLICTRPPCAAHSLLRH